MSKQITIDNWTGNRNSPETFELNETFSARKFLSMLDGKKRTQIIFEMNEKDSLIIGGNLDLFVVIYSKENDESSFIQFDPTKSQNLELALVIGGQTGLFLEKYCVSFEKALKSIKFYIEHLSMSPELDWEQEY